MKIKHVRRFYKIDKVFYSKVGGVYTMFYVSRPKWYTHHKPIIAKKGLNFEDLRAIRYYLKIGY